MAGDESVTTASRLSDWIPLDLKGKPIYAGIDEKARMDTMRTKINSVRVRWNDPVRCAELSEDIRQLLKVNTLARELQEAIQGILGKERYWVDHHRIDGSTNRASTTLERENYAALELYTTNDGYKKVFGYINQMFRKHYVSEIEVYGAVALVELLTIDIYNLRLASFGCSKYFNFQGIVHRGLSVDLQTLKAFQDLMQQPVQSRHFSVPLAFMSTSINQARIQEFLDKTEKGKCRMHWKIHVHELDPNLLAQYKIKHPESVVTTICALPISYASEYANEQEILLRGPFLNIIRIYEEPAGEHVAYVVEMVMLNANRDHGSETAEHHGEKLKQREHFGQMCAASRYEICASLARKYGLPEANDYEQLAKTTLQKLSSDHIVAPFNPGLSESWSVPRPSWIGASLSTSFPAAYAKRRERFSRASFSGNKWPIVQEIIDEEYEWQQADWCNVPRLYDTAEDAANGSGFSVLHQAAFNHAAPDVIQNFINLGAWRTMKSLKREGFVTAQDIAVEKGLNDIASLLAPCVYHRITRETLATLESRVHRLMQELARENIDRHAVRLPQLSVMTEMKTDRPSLWCPIPGMYGGFVLDLDPERPNIKVTRISHTFPKKKSVHVVDERGVEDL